MKTLPFKHQTGRSRLAPVKRPVDNSASGSTVKRCYECLRTSRDTKETIHNGLLLLRVRYGLPYSELPDCSPGELSRFLLFLLLQGKERASVVFPRCQRRGENGLCKLQRLCRRDRWAFAHGVSSIKRNLPSGCSRCTPSVRSQWEENVLSQPPPSSPEYLAHVRRVATQVFTSGWDRNYHSFVGCHVPNPTARFASKSRADHLWAGRREEFLTMTTKESECGNSFFARYKEVMSAGKKRPLLIFDELVDLLAPMHSMMYHTLCKQDWLLCGPPSEKQMTSVLVNDYQTSVDLVAATDGLCHDVAETILDAAFFTSVKIPRTLRSLAKGSLSPIFGVEGGYKRVRHGQMMGAYLSFPLLCLQSYCAASWAARFDSNARFIVNGDDCVISAGRYVTVQDYPQGYRLNDDKTIRAKNVCEINSTCFLQSKGRWREVRHLRRGGATADFPGMQHMAKAVSSCGQGMVDAFQRCRIGRRWGFLPSQLGHYGYPAHLRESGLRVRRTYTPLPEPVVDCSFPEELVRITGRDPTPVEAEALRVVMWRHGRMGGLKRDVFSPSCGKVRRTYSYRKQSRYSALSFVYSRTTCSSSGRKEPLMWLPANFVSEEEAEGFDNLALFRAEWDAGFIRHPLDVEG